MISSGVALASHGELHFDLTGFLIQAAAVGVRVIAPIFSCAMIDLERLSSRRPVWS
jgi:hypothetical protein